MLKFKYFYDETGVAPEEKINKWLEKNPTISIVSMYGNYDNVYFLYEQRLSPEEIIEKITKNGKNKI